jgi:hypothetical protein
MSPHCEKNIFLAEFHLPKACSSECNALFKHDYQLRARAADYLVDTAVDGSCIK